MPVIPLRDRRAPARAAARQALDEMNACDEASRGSLIAEYLASSGPRNRGLRAKLLLARCRGNGTLRAFVLKAIPNLLRVQTPKPLEADLLVIGLGLDASPERFDRALTLLFDPLQATERNITPGQVHRLSAAVIAALKHCTDCAQSSEFVKLRPDVLLEEATRSGSRAKVAKAVLRALPDEVGLFEPLFADSDARSTLGQFPLNYLRYNAWVAVLRGSRKYNAARQLSSSFASRAAS